MASNRLPDGNDKLFPLAGDMIDRLTKHSGEVGVKQIRTTWPPSTFHPIRSYRIN
jgi:hypothetical protein